MRFLVGIGGQPLSLAPLAATTPRCPSTCPPPHRNYAEWTPQRLIACALAQKACQEGYTALYLRLPRLFEDLSLAHGDGRFSKLMAGLAKTGLIILDDWGVAKFSAEQRRDLLELLDDRHGSRSTVVASQVPVDHWHEVIGDPTLGAKMTLYTEGFDCFVTSTGAPIATGGSDSCRAGLSPAEEPRLFTAPPIFCTKSAALVELCGLSPVIR